MAGEYMNNLGSYPQYGMGPQMPMAGAQMQNFNPFASQNPFGNLANFYAQQQQARMQNMPGMAPMQPQQNQQQTMGAPLTGYTIRPASNIDEVRATPIDLMTTNVFINSANDEIYVSKINDKGAKDIIVYRQFDPSVPEIPIASTQVLEEQSSIPAFDLSGIYERFGVLENRLDQIIESQKIPGGKNSGKQKEEPKG